jgi:hypothetical protein
MNIERVRYALFWIALEALFGPEDAREMTFRLSQRIALFLAPDRAAARELFNDVKEAYGYRSKIVHGRWRRDPDGLARMAEVEAWARQCLIRVLRNAPARASFSDRKQREAYLDGLPYS